MSLCGVLPHFWSECGGLVLDSFWSDRNSDRACVVKTRKWFDTSEVAEACQVTIQAVNVWIRAGLLPAFKPYPEVNRRRVLAEDAERFLLARILGGKVRRRSKRKPKPPSGVGG